MCVIFVVSKDRPSREMVDRAWETNRDGGGIAWREGKGDKVLVHWKKGIEDVNEMQDLCATLPLPYIAHFRIASIGGVKPTLTHPFPVSPDASTALEGKTDGLVAFHNGHWTQWNEKAFDAMINSGNKPPAGDWSDSRAIAWMMNIYGPNMMEFLTAQRGAIIGPKILDVFTGPGWANVNGVFCSNDHFWSRRNYSNSNINYGTFRMCRDSFCRERVEPGKDFCSKHLYKEKSSSDSKTDTEGEPGKKTTQLQIVTGGSQRPLAILARGEVEQLFKGQVISKSMYKKFQKNFSDLTSGGNRAERAKKKLVQLTDRATELFVNGSNS